MTEQIEQRAALFLLAREEAGWSPTEEAQFQAWLDKSDRHKAVFWRLEYGWKSADRIRAIDAAPLPPPMAMRLIRTFASLRGAAAIAASLLLLLAAFLVLREPEASNYRQFASTDQPMILSFEDGTRIELDARSSVRVAMTRQSRLVLLDQGEAYFDVSHDATRPFKVLVGRYEVVDLGTKFAIRKDRGTIRTAVLEGEVQLGLANSAVGSTLKLKRGGWAISERSASYVHSNDLAGVEAMLGWRSGMIIFSHAPLDEAAREFNRYNDKKLVIADARVAAIRIDGAFKTGNVEGFSRLMCDAYGLRIEESDAEIKISQK